MGNDIKAAEETYSGFVSMVKWGTIVTAVGIAIVIMLIA